MFDLDYYVFKRYKDISSEHDELNKSLILYKKYSYKYLQTYYKICEYMLNKYSVADYDTSNHNEMKEKLFNVSINRDVLFHSCNILQNNLDIYNLYDNLVITENLSKYYKNLFNTRDKDLCGELLYHTWASIFNNYYHIFIQKIEQTSYIN